MWYLVEIHSVIPKLRTAKCALGSSPPMSLPAFGHPPTARRAAPVDPATCMQKMLHAEFFLGALEVHRGRCAYRIQYTSGEIEELDLEEIIREGHMSLITQ